MQFINKTDNVEEISKIIDDDEITPYVNLTFNIHLEGFGIYDILNDKFIEPDSIDAFGHKKFSIKKKVNQLYVNIYYQCGEDYNCTSLEEYIEKEGYRLGEYYLIYPRYTINHFANPPVIKGTDTSEDIYLNHGFSLQIFRIKLAIESWDWEVIKYQDQKTLFDTLTNKKTEYIFGETKNRRKEDEEYENYHDKIQYSSEKGYFIHLFRINIYKSNEKFVLYKRRKVEILDIFAKIGALFSTVKYFFSFVLFFYSTNFNNYKIMYKLLNSSKEPIKVIELDKQYNKKPSSKTIKENDKLIDDINTLISFLLS